MVPDLHDNCPDVANPGQEDSDGDGVGDACDGCPEDAAKTSPGICGCGMPDVDTDGDGFSDCFDLCPDDAAKNHPGICGCGVPDVELDANDIIDCLEGPVAPNPTPGCCAPGAFPLVGLFLPMVMAGWKFGRRRRDGARS